MAYATAIAAVASVVISAVGTGLAYYGQQQQANNAQAVADYNYKIQQRNAQMNAAVAAQQNQWQQQVYANQVITANNNAKGLADEGRAAEAQAREQARRTRDENDRKLALQRVRYAKGGVTSEGSPLQVMSETAGLLELGVQDIAYQGDMEGRAADRRALLAKSDASQAIFDAGVAQYKAAAQQAGFAIDLNKAAADRVAGYSQASGLRTAAMGTLISGASSALQSTAGIYRTYSRAY